MSDQTPEQPDPKKLEQELDALLNQPEASDNDMPAEAPDPDDAPVLLPQELIEEPQDTAANIAGEEDDLETELDQLMDQMVVTPKEEDAADPASPIEAFSELEQELDGLIEKMAPGSTPETTAAASAPKFEGLEGELDGLLQEETEAEGPRETVPIEKAEPNPVDAAMTGLEQELDELIQDIEQTNDAPAEQDAAQVNEATEAPGETVEAGYLERIQNIPGQAVPEHLDSLLTHIESQQAVEETSAAIGKQAAEQQVEQDLNQLLDNLQTTINEDETDVGDRPPMMAPNAYQILSGLGSGILDLGDFPDSSPSPTEAMAYDALLPSDRAEPPTPEELSKMMDPEGLPDLAEVGAGSGLLSVGTGSGMLDLENVPDQPVSVDGLMMDTSLPGDQPPPTAKEMNEALGGALEEVGNGSGLLDMADEAQEEALPVSLSQVGGGSGLLDMSGAATEATDETKEPTPAETTPAEPAGSETVTTEQLTDQIQAMLEEAAGENLPAEPAPAPGAPPNEIQALERELEAMLGTVDSGAPAAPATAAAVDAEPPAGSDLKVQQETEAMVAAAQEQQLAENDPAFTSADVAMLENALGTKPAVTPAAGTVDDTPTEPEIFAPGAGEDLATEPGRVSRLVGMGWTLFRMFQGLCRVVTAAVVMLDRMILPTDKPRRNFIGFVGMQWLAMGACLVSLRISEEGSSARWFFVTAVVCFLPLGFFFWRFFILPRHDNALPEETADQAPA